MTLVNKIRRSLHIKSNTLKWKILAFHFSLVAVNADLTVVNVRFSGPADASPVKLFPTVKSALTAANEK